MVKRSKSKIKPKKSSKKQFKTIRTVPKKKSKKNSALGLELKLNRFRFELSDLISKEVPLAVFAPHGYTTTMICSNCSGGAEHGTGTLINFTDCC